MIHKAEFSLRRIFAAFDAFCSEPCKFCFVNLHPVIPVCILFDSICVYEAHPKLINKCGKALVIVYEMQCGVISSKYDLKIIHTFWK